MLKRDHSAGFTLLELLIVVIIVSILAAVAIPQFGRMTRRSRAAEGANIVGAVMTAESVLRQETGAFAAFANQGAIAGAGLLVDVPPESVNEFFDYTGAVAGNVCTVTATGEAGTPAAGITVTGTIDDQGTRTLVTAGL